MTIAQPTEELLTFDEALQVLGTSRPTLYRLLSQGDVKGLKVGKQWRFRRSDLKAYIERSPVEISQAPSQDLDTALAFFQEELPTTDAYDTTENKTAQLSQLLIRLAIDRKASDIHLEPASLEGQLLVLVRYRIDGVLHHIQRLPMSLHEPLTAQFKMMSDMNVGEKRVPQDGRLLIKQADKEFDLRLSAMPSIYGETLVIRIIDRSSVFVGLEKLGLLPDDLNQFRTIMRQPNGLILVTGPTGSGKTTTIYSCLELIASTEIKTLTMEDPVEYLLPFVTQCAVNVRAGLTFAAGLRTFLRQDPDVIFVGEVRNLETIQISIEAALTGHLVLSTLHANDAASAIQRLLGVGVEPYLLAPTLVAVVAQRLARRICPDCREPLEAASLRSYEPIRELAAAGGYDFPSDAVFYHGRGCDHCRGRGYRGRIGLFEIVETNEAIAEAILKEAGYEELTRLAFESGARNLWADGLRKVVAGETTLDEIRRVVFTAGL